MVQKIIYAEEVEVWYILPSIRKNLVEGLVKEGLSQKEIAKLMNLTEAAVSNYLKKKRANSKIFPQDFNKEIGISTKKIISNKKLLHSELLRLNKLAISKGIVCKLHKEKTVLKKHELPCKVCSYKGK